MNAFKTAVIYGSKVINGAVVTHQLFFLSPPICLCPLTVIRTTSLNGYLIVLTAPFRRRTVSAADKTPFANGSEHFEVHLFK